MMTTNPKSELQELDYPATQQELRIIDAAMASIDSGETATDDEIKAAFANFIRREARLFKKQAR